MADGVFDGLGAFSCQEIGGEVPVAYSGDGNLYEVFRVVGWRSLFLAGNCKEKRDGCD